MTNRKLVGMTRYCVKCGRRRSAALSVCPEDGTPLSDVELTPEDERSISIDITTQSPMETAAAVTASDGTLARGTQVGEYVIEGTIGAGGGGTVYRASHSGIGKRAAIKVIHFGLAAVPSSVQRFLDEARTVNAISHPSLVDIFAVGKLPDGRPYLVMELLEGRPLSMALREGNLSMPEKLRIVEQACIALDAAHGKGVVHRDLKPDNIFLLAEGHNLRLKLLDFGVAKLLDPGSGQPRENTRTGVVLGTPVYMAPEQILGDQVTSATDVYALGVVLYRLFTGRPPFLADTTVELFMQHVQKSAPLPDELSPLVPMRLSRLMHQMLSKNPTHRPTLTVVRAAALATLYPNSKLAAALPPAKRAETAGDLRIEAARESNNRWFGIGAGVVIFAVLYWALIGRTPDTVVHEAPVIDLRGQPMPGRSQPVAVPPPVMRAELPRPNVQLTDARVSLEVFPRSSDVRINQQKLAVSDGRVVFYATPNVPQALKVSAPGYVAHLEQRTFQPEERVDLVVTLTAEPQLEPPKPTPAPRPVKRTAPAPGKNQELIDPF